MKSFTSKSYNFTTIALGQKLVYTTFLFFTMCGWVTILAFYFYRTGFGFQHLIDYYCGNEEKLQYTKSFLELWEVSHFHLFITPVIFLILAHLFMLSRWKDKRKVNVFLCGLLGMLLDIGSPWLMVYGHPWFVVLKVIGRILFHGSFFLFMWVPFHEMWLCKPKRRRRSLKKKAKKRLVKRRHYTKKKV